MVVTIMKISLSECSPWKALDILPRIGALRRRDKSTIIPYLHNARKLVDPQGIGASISVDFRIAKIDPVLALALLIIVGPRPSILLDAEPVDPAGA